MILIIEEEPKTVCSEKKADSLNYKVTEKFSVKT